LAFFGVGLTRALVVSGGNSETNAMYVVVLIGICICFSPHALYFYCIKKQIMHKCIKVLVSGHEYSQIQKI
jgi:hypothetical protein